MRQLTKKKAEQPAHQVEEALDKIGEDAGPGIEGGKYGSEEGAKDVEDGFDKGGDGGSYGRHLAFVTRDFRLSEFVILFRGTGLVNAIS